VLNLAVGLAQVRLALSLQAKWWWPFVSGQCHVGVREAGQPLRQQQLLSAGSCQPASALCTVDHAYRRSSVQRGSAQRADCPN
jgi:hypothetical protein